LHSVYVFLRWHLSLQFAYRTACNCTRIYHRIALLYCISPYTRAIYLCISLLSRKESAREAIFGRHCDDFRNRAMHALARDFVRAYAVRSTCRVYVARIIRHLILSNPSITHVEYLTSVSVLQSLIVCYDPCMEHYEVLE